MLVQSLNFGYNYLVTVDSRFYESLTVGEHNSRGGGGLKGNITFTQPPNPCKYIFMKMSH